MYVIFASIISVVVLVPKYKMVHFTVSSITGINKDNR